YADDHYFDPDPVLACKIPEDGEYTLHVRDAIYRGRADFVYRISAREGNAPAYKLPEPPPLPLPLTESAKLPASGETAFPVLIKGTVKSPGASESYKIRARQGEKIVAEIFARRLLSPLDSYLTVCGPDGKKIAANDDFPRLKAGVILQDSDSYLCFTAPEAGEYTLRVTDNAGHGGKDYGYYLRIDHERPDFNIYCCPSSLPVEMGGNTPLEIVVDRLEGFHGSIRLQLQAPGQYCFTGNSVIPDGCCRTSVTLSCIPDQNRGAVSAAITAVSGKIRKQVIPADELTQAFAYTHLLPAESLLFIKRWRAYGSRFFSWLNPHPLKLLPGKTARITILRGQMPEDADGYEFRLDDNGVEGVTLTEVKTEEREQGTAEIILTFRAEKNVKKQSFNQIVKGVFSYTRPNKEGKLISRKSEFAMPALRIEIGG
ncbi:MAG: PPC domain-containing protein, partial [Victivallales bacterium]|nr:PPC domain-containing protein [Victivallales bacterium]